ncbi:MAG: hypothetical protein Q8R11_02725 [bacterium]|nr:hypothetical protein [bacterium]
MDLKAILTILHLLGVVIGVGSAYGSDLTFLQSVRSGIIDQCAFVRLKRLSRFVWIGLAIIAVSGIGLFLLDPHRYLASSKFLAKMTVVAMLVANGLVFHWVHLPRLAGKTWRNHRSALLLSGVVSFVSWTSAIILGFLRAVPLAYGEIMGIYIGVIVGGICIGLLLQPFIFPKKNGGS